MTKKADFNLDDPIVKGVWIEGGANGSAAQGAVAPSASNAAHTTAATDYSFSWQAPTVNHIMLQNNTAAVVNWELDATATAGSPALAAGQTVFLDVVASVLHLFTAAQQNVNGAAAANVVVRAWQ